MKNLKRIIAGTIALLSFGGVAVLNILRKNKKISTAIAIPTMIVLGVLGLASTYTTVTNELPTFAAGTRKVAIEINPNQVSGSGDLTNFPVLLTEDNLPSELLDADGTYAASSTGCDLRFYSDSGLTTQLAHDIETFSLDNNPASSSAGVWVKIPTLSGSATTTIYVQYNDDTLACLAADSTYGSEAVWSSYAIVAHNTGSVGATEKKLNETGITSLNIVETGTPTSVTGFFGNSNGAYAIDTYTSTGNYLGVAESASDLSFGNSDAYTVSFWIKLNSSVNSNNLGYVFDKWGNARYPFSFVWDNNTGDADARKDLQFQIYDGTNSAKAENTTNLLTDSWHKVTAVRNGTNAILYVDNSTPSSVSDTTWGNNVTNTNAQKAGSPSTLTSGYNINIDGIDEIRIRKSALSADWITTEYNNQGTPSTFAIAGTPSDVGGATPPTVTTQAVTNIATSSATFNGTITAVGSASSTHRGFVWDTSSQSAPGNVAPSASGYASTTNESGTFGTGAFSLGITDLAQGTTYYVRAYASSSDGFGYGDEVNFTSSSTAANTPPTISSVSDNPDPVTVGSSTTFSVDWNDVDTEGVKMFICKTDSISTSSPSCGGDNWCTNSNDFDLTDPITCQYTASTTDIGVNNYYAFVCDDEISCSTSTSGTFEATTTPITGTVTLTDIADRIIYQRGLDNEYDITVSGTYTGNPSTIEARVINASTSAEVLTWTVVDSSLSGGTFSGTLSNVPDGGWYNLQVRFGENTSIVDNGTNEWGVGILVATYGQSNMAYWFNTTKGTTQTPNDRISYYNPNGWNTPDGDYEVADGAVGFANYLIETLDIPVGMLDFGIPSAGIVSLKSGGASYTALSNGVTAVGGSVEYFLWIQGETDGDNAMAEATYEGHLTDLIGTVQTDFSRSGEDVPFIIAVIGRRTSSVTSDVGWNNVRNADKDVAAADTTVYIGSWNVDIPLVDGIHATPAGFVTVGQRMANTVLYLEGESACYESPVISTFEEVDDQTVDIRLTHNCGTDFTPTSSITGFRVLDDGSEETITSATRVNASQIRLVISGTITGTLSVDYQWGQAPTITGVINDNSTLTLPLAFSTEISEYIAPPEVIYPIYIFK